MNKDNHGQKKTDEVSDNMSATYKPPLVIKDSMIALVSEISEEIGRISILQEGHVVTPHLRRKNRIRTIHSSLAIENNTLTIDQVTAIIDGKRVLGNPNEIREVRNAYDAYELMLALDPLSVDDLLKAHGLMMAGLIPENGVLRTRGIGVFNGQKVIHMAPPAEFVPGQIKDLIAWYKDSRLHPLIKSSVFHYEFEFIHPFADGNGRMGRMWHTMLLGNWKGLFFWIPVEELIQTRQKEYYDALNMADSLADSSCFVELILEIIRDSLKELTDARNISDQVSDQDADQVDASVKRLLAIIGNETLPASEIMKRLGLSHRPTFRKNYLNPALEANLIERTIPDKPNSSKQRYRKIRH